MFDDLQGFFTGICQRYSWGFCSTNFWIHHITAIIFSADKQIVLGYIGCSNEHWQAIQNYVTLWQARMSNVSTGMLLISGLQHWGVSWMRGRSRIACGNGREGIGSWMGCWGTMGVGMLFVTSISCTTKIKIWSMGNSTLAAVVQVTRCHAPNRFGTVNMEDNLYIEWSWCEGWVRWNLIVAIYRTRRLSWCKRWLLMSSSHHSHKNHQEAEETEGITSILVWEWNAHICSLTPIPERSKKLKNWWRNEGEREETIFSTQMSFLGAQCWHSDILNSSVVSEAIKHVTIPSESLERGLSACQVPT